MQSADSEAARQLESAEFISGPISTEEQQMAAALDSNRCVLCVCIGGGVLLERPISARKPISAGGAGQQQVCGWGVAMVADAQQRCMGQRGL